MVARQTFDVLDICKPTRRGHRKLRAIYSCIPEFIHDNRDTVPMMLSEDSP